MASVRARRVREMPRAQTLTPSHDACPQASKVCHTVRQCVALRKLVSKSMYSHLRTSEIDDAERETGLRLPDGRTPSQRVMRELRDVLDTVRLAAATTPPLAVDTLRAAPDITVELMQFKFPGMAEVKPVPAQHRWGCRPSYKSVSSNAGFPDCIP